MQYNKKGNNMPKVQPVEEKRVLTRIKLAAGLNLASHTECFSPSSKIETKEEWLKNHDLFMSNHRAFALVDTASEVYFMDCVTGTLYQLGECMSSSELKFNEFKRDKERATGFLLSIQRSEIGD